MQKKESKQIALTKKHIKDTLMNLLAEKKINEIKVSELCKYAEINRTTFYNYYSNPTELMESIRVDIINDVQNIYHKYDSLPMPIKTQRALNETLNYIKNELVNIEVLSHYASDALSLPITVTSIILEPYIDSLLKNKNDKDSNTIKLFSIYGTVGIIKNWKRNSSMKSTSDLTKDILNMINTQIK